MNIDLYGNILPEENTTYKVSRFEQNIKGNTKEGQRDWLAYDENGKKIMYKVGNAFKDVIIAGAMAPSIARANAVRYKRVRNPDMFCGDNTDLSDPNVRGFAWIPCVIQ